MIHMYVYVVRTRVGCIKVVLLEISIRDMFLFIYSAMTDCHVSYVPYINKNMSLIKISKYFLYQPTLRSTRMYSFCVGLLYDNKSGRKNQLCKLYMGFCICTLFYVFYILVVHLGSIHFVVI